MLILTILAGPFWTIRTLSAAEPRTVTADQSLRAGAAHQWIFGSDYRDLWTTPIEVEVLDLKKEAGVLQSMPRLVVLPDDPALGEFRELYADCVGTLIPLVNATP
ncbi:MAG: hypothetical protein OEU26_10955 [Candidatus Tectomicrobia bacterium]|nr:hypothetical protein [Candidatus Tectomicrobia bacterium]